MRRLPPELPPNVAVVVRRLPPDLKRGVRAALQALSEDPGLGEPLRGELEGLWNYRVRRFRIVYAVDRRHGRLRIMAIGHRRAVYEELVGSREET